MSGGLGMQRQQWIAPVSARNQETAQAVNFKSPLLARRVI
jgi:hypothetical protein